MFILRLINDGTAQKEMCDTLYSPNQAVKKVILSFGKIGHVTLVENPDDRRARCIMLTEKGQAFQKQIISQIEKAELETFASLTEQELQIMTDLWDKYSTACISKIKRLSAFQNGGTHMKKLGFGLMRLPLVNDDFSQPDKVQLCDMVDSFLKKGFQYFDTAWFYHNGQSEAAVKECLVERYPRSAFLLADKMPLILIQKECELEKYFNAQLVRCGVDYFDYYLIHDMGGNRRKTAEDTHVFEFLSAKKKAGLVRHIGFSFHDTADVLDGILTEHPEVDFVQIQLNYLDWENDTIQSRKCYEIAKRHRKPVIVMEPVKGGTLANIPQEVESLFRAYRPDLSVASWAIRFAASHENVMLVLSGMSNMEQVKDNLSYMENFTPFIAEEYALVQKAADIINGSIAIPCTGCAYCINKCPKNIAIPKYFALYNADMQELKTKVWTAQTMLYNHFSEQYGKASNCIECGQCEKMCPQHLPIREWLKKVTARFERTL